MKSLVKLAVLAAAAALTACSTEETAVPRVEIVRSSLARDTSPSLSDAEKESFAKSQADFAVDIFHAVGTGPEAKPNLFLSPHSISTALAMTYPGARGKTAEEMKRALRFELPDEQLQKAFNHVDLQLSSRASGDPEKPLRLDVVNSVWMQKGMVFGAPFLDGLAVNHDAGVNVLDFKAAPVASRLAINGWVADRTERRIQDLLAEPDIDAKTRMVLVNAVYLDARWASPFEKTASAPMSFTKLDGGAVTAEGMSQVGSFSHAKTDAYEAIELPYAGGDLAYVAIMPTAGTFATFESSLTGGKVLEILAGLATKKVWLTMPKLKLESSFDLKLALRSLGMKQPFERGADFSGISTDEELVIKAVVHKAFVAIDEEGTEAAAATAVVVGVPSSSGGSTEVPPRTILDRPYVQAIVDRQTKAVVFLGRVLEPGSR